MNDAKASIIASRKIVSKEKETFFDSYSYPSIDVENILSSVGPKSKKIFDTHVSYEYKEEKETRAKREKQQEKVALLRAEVEAINERIVDLKARINHASDAERPDIESEFSRLGKDLLAKESALIVEEKKLSADVSR